jgi:hypothetical protein
MDDSRFDQLTRLVARGASRRAILKGLLGLGAAVSSAEGVDARPVRTRPTIPPPPPPTTSPPTTTTAVPCPGQDQCPGSTLCCPTGTCARAGNQAICCDGTDGNGTVVCGFDCCDTEDQCCDGECCPDETVCLARVFGEGPFVEEEVCCPIELTCRDIASGEGLCCDGECFDPEGGVVPAQVLNPDFLCCPAGGTVCEGGFETLCCQGDTPQCCLRGGVAFCIAADACCGDADCDDLDDPAGCLEGTCTEEFVCEAQTVCGVLQTCCIGGDDVCCPEERECCGPVCCDFGETCCERTLGGVLVQVCIDPQTQCCTNPDCDALDDPANCIRGVCRRQDQTCVQRSECGADEVCCAGDAQSPGVCITDDQCCSTEECTGCEFCDLGTHLCVSDCGTAPCCEEGPDPASWFCADGECCPDGSGCTAGLRCCTPEVDESFCIDSTQCCDDGDCEACEVCVDNSCEFDCNSDEECCGDSCCAGLCCEFDEEFFCNPGGECCSDDECDATACEFCSNGTCAPGCTGEGERCCPVSGGGFGCVFAEVCAATCTSDAECSGQVCCGGVCCDSASCCERSSGTLVCVFDDPAGSCCNDDDCGDHPSACFTNVCIEGDDGNFFCQSVTVCDTRTEQCCNDQCVSINVCCREESCVPPQCCFRLICVDTCPDIFGGLTCCPDGVCKTSCEASQVLLAEGPECTVDADCVGMHACDQGNPPSWNPYVCSQGACLPGASQLCDDNDPCTTNTCIPATGCAFSPVADCREGAPQASCCPPGYSCGDDGSCGCSLMECQDPPRCAACCGPDDCLDLGELPCVACNGACSQLPDGTPCTGGSCARDDCECQLGICLAVA